MGGHIRSFASKQVLLTAVAQEIVGPSDRRSGLIIMPPLNGTVFIGTDNTISVGNGISLHHDSDPLSLFREQVGDLVRRGLWAVGLAAYGVNRDFATGQLKGFNSGAGQKIATLTCPAGCYVEVDGWSASVDKAEIHLYTLTDSTPTTYIQTQITGGETIVLNKPIRIPDGLNALLTVQASATSTNTYANIWGRSVRAPSGLSEALNLSVIEIFDCDCPQYDANTLLEVIRRKL